MTCRCCSLLLKNTVKLVEFHYTELTFSQNKDELNQTKVQHFYHHIALFTSILIANYIPRKKQKRLFRKKNSSFFSELRENHEKYNKEVRLSTGKVSCLPLVSFEKYHRSGPGACSGGKGLWGAVAILRVCDLFGMVICDPLKGESWPPKTGGIKFGHGLNHLGDVVSLILLLMSFWNWEFGICLLAFREEKKTTS